MNDKNRKMAATIYTISTHDTTSDYDDAHCTGGSFRSRGDAISELTDWVIERISLRGDIAFAFAHDAENEEMRDAVEYVKGRLVYKKKTEDEIREYVADQIGGCGAYKIFNEQWNDMFLFSLDENDLEIRGAEELEELVSAFKNSNKED